MKKALLILCLFAAGAAHAQIQPTAPELRAKEQAQVIEKAGVGTIGALDAKNGFRQFRLDAPISEMPELRSRGKNVYVAPSQSMTVGEAKITSLLFLANKGRLSAIMLSAYEATNCEKLLDALTTQYGPGVEVEGNSLVWKGANVTMQYEKKTDFVPSGLSTISPRQRDSCTVLMLSNAIVAELDAEKAAAAKKAAGDL